MKKYIVVGILVTVCVVVALLWRNGPDVQNRQANHTAEETEMGHADPKQEEVVDTVASVSLPNEESNVLLIILDDIGLDYFPGYLHGQDFEKAPMPRITQLMDQGHVFENMQVYDSCSPTRASTLTGLHGIDTGVLEPGKTSYLDPQYGSIQQEIKIRSNGAVSTAVFGKWHLLGSNRAQLNHPSQFGIDHYEGMIEGNHEDYAQWTKTINGTQQASNVYSTTDLTTSAINWINDQDGQWFTWLAYTAPHSPLHLPPTDLHSFDQLSGDERDLRRNKNQYFQAMLESVDSEIGRLLDSMDSDTRANTYVIVLGDNGTGGQTADTRFQQVGAKGTLHVGGIHVPMVVYSPYQSGGVRHAELTSSIDIYPTVIDMLGLGTVTDRSGSSVYPLVSGKQDQYTPHTYVFAQNLDAAVVRSSGYKLIRENSGAELFYDIDADFYETSSLLDGTMNSIQQAGYVEHAKALDEYLRGNY